MEAAIWYGKGKVKIEDMAVPQPGPGQVRLKVKVCGICGTDLHEYPGRAVSDSYAATPPNRTAWRTRGSGARIFFPRGCFGRRC